MIIELQSTYNIVFDCLSDIPSTSCNDWFLYLEVCRKIGIDSNTSLSDLILSESLPNFESVRRSRQKIQRCYSQLRSEKVVEERKEFEKWWQAFLYGTNKE
jgi:hypothetical protein